MKKILIVDDEALNRKILAKILEREGYVTVQSNNGLHAHETLIVNDDIGLIVTDIVMPEMSGKEFISKIRLMKKYEAMPAIFISAALEIKDIFDILDDGVSWFMPKPIKREEFLNLILHIYQTHKY